MLADVTPSPASHKPSLPLPVPLYVLEHLQCRERMLTILEDAFSTVPASTGIGDDTTQAGQGLQQRRKYQAFRCAGGCNMTAGRHQGGWGSGTGMLMRAYVLEVHCAACQEVCACRFTPCVYGRLFLCALMCPGLLLRVVLQGVEHGLTGRRCPAVVRHTSKT